jgi:hypothetical protein
MLLADKAAARINLFIVDLLTSGRLPAAEARFA